MLEPPKTFLWFLHQPASTRWLKLQLAAARPDLRLAFSRPGLTTFKTDAADTERPAPNFFARAYGWALGRANDAADVLTLAGQLGNQPLRLHVFERDMDCPADERDSTVAGSRPRTLEQAIRAAGPARFLTETKALEGDLVLNVITAPSERPDEPLFVGWHRHDKSRGPGAGGGAHMRMPADSPSRAWSKIEEAIAWSGLIPPAGDSIVELGSAPGGACFSLLNRGLNVHGVDPGLMSPVALNFVGPHGNRFVHHACPAAEVERRDLPRRIQWLASDVNLAPMIALKYVERFVALARNDIRGAFITMKIHDEGIFEALPQLADRIIRLGARETRFTQLPSHRSEIIAILAW